MNRWSLKGTRIKFRAVPSLFAGARRKQLAELQAHFDQLQGAELDLKQASGDLETQFLTTSSELEVLAGYGSQFVEQVQKLVGLATGKGCDDTVFSNAIGLIERATQFLTLCQGKTDDMLKMLRSYKAQVEHLMGVEAELQRTMLPLQFVQVLFRVESTRLNPEVQQMFESLTREIEVLHSQVREIFGTKLKQLDQTHRTIGQVIGQLDRQSLTLRQVITTQKVDIESTLATLKQEMSLNHERDSKLGHLSKALAGEVNQVVMGLQIQDIISQKVQHVLEALPPVEAHFAEFTAAASPAAGGKAMQFLQQSCRLEARQLEAVQTELAKAETSIQGGIQKVIVHLKEIDSQSLSLQEFNLLTTSFNGMVQVLVEMIEEVRSLVAATVASAAEVYAMLRPLGSLASDLTTIVHDIAARIHLIGLNAQVQAVCASQEERGTALEVLSARTSEISSETNRITEHAATELDALAAGLAESVRVFEKIYSDGLAQKGFLDRQGCAEEAALHSFRDSALETLSALGTSLDAIQAQAKSALATVQFDHFHSVTLPALRKPLEAIADAAELWLQANPIEQAEGSLIEGFQRHYTMASEREVFASVASGRGAANPGTDVIVPVAQLEVELFANLPSEPQSEPLPEGRPEDVGVPEKVKIPDGCEMGANVDLF